MVLYRRYLVFGDESISAEGKEQMMKIWFICSKGIVIVEPVHFNILQAYFIVRVDCI